MTGSHFYPFIFNKILKFTISGSSRIGFLSYFPKLRFLVMGNVLDSGSEYIGAWPSFLSYLLCLTSVLFLPIDGVARN